MLVVGAAQEAVARPLSQAITVHGAHLLKGGAPWIPRGVQIVGLVAPDNALSGKYAAAHAHYSEGELARARADHADTIRFQVSQFGIDPESSLYSPAYVREVQSGVEAARSLGLEVIVSVQAEPPAGQNQRCLLPDAGTERVWQELAPMFAGDRGVMFELYNEPFVDATPGGWQEWRAGGLVADSSGSSCQAVGMQTLVGVIRHEHAGNVIIVPGLSGEKSLAGMPRLADPTDRRDPQLAYGIHYPSLPGGTVVWDQEFGRISARVPVIVTEWDSNSTHNCLPSAPALAALLIDYLASREIGIVGFAFDLPGTIVADWSYTPTTYSGFACGTPGGGPGQLLFGGFAGLTQASSRLRGDTPFTWIVHSSELRRRRAPGPRLARRFFDTPRTFVVGASGGSLGRLRATAAVPTAMFTSETALAAAVGGNGLPAGTRAVIYDDEHWSLTPRAQQVDPASYYHRAALVAHRHGLLLIAAPGVSLVTAVAPRTPATRTYTAFLKRRIAAKAARYADLYEVQGQGLEADSGKLLSFVRAAAAQARAAHPGIQLVGSLTTNLGGLEFPSQTLVGAVLASQPVVSGYALDDPPASSQCPTCSGPFPRMVKSLLHALTSRGQ